MSPRPFRRTSLLAGAAFAAALAFAPAALAQSPEEIKIARQMAGEGFTAYKAGEFDKALGLFQQAKQLYPSAQILRMTGYSELALERWEKSAATLEAALASTVGPLSADDKKDVQDQLNKALAHLGTVDVTSRVDGATVSIDDGPDKTLPLDKPVRLLEGKHHFTVRAPDHLDATDEIKVEGGKAASLAIDPAEKPKPKPPPPPPKPKPLPPARKPWIPYQKPIGFGLVGGGVALGGAALGVALAGAQLRRLVDADVATHLTNYGKACAKGDPRLCAYDITVTNQEADRADALRTASIGLGIGAGVLAAAGVVLVVAAPKAQPKPPPADTQGPPPESPPPPTAQVSCTIAGLGGLCAGTF
jgi:hypothetical protein